MDKENELLAQWLFGGPPDKDDDSGLLWRFHGRRIWATPEFRLSNEWAGALLTKLGDFEIALDSAKNVDGTIGWNYTDIEGEWTGSRTTWRDAVADAALEIIGRCDNGN